MLFIKFKNKFVLASFYSYFFFFFFFFFCFDNRSIRGETRLLRY
jgi:hypothetical protein